MRVIRRLRLLIAAISLVPTVCVAQTSYERLAATAKLWAYIKYVHPRVTASDIDWDAAFARVAPKVLDAKTEPEFEAAVSEMLASLRDPATHVLAPRAPGARQHVAVRIENGVVIAQFDSGPPQTQAQVAELLRQAANGPLVLDLRGSGVVLYPLSPMVPVALESIGPSMPMRKHDGYDESLWEWHDGLHLPAAPNPVRPVFLVNSQTEIPPMALAVQNSGAGAIVSEDAISDQQVVESESVPVLGNLRVQVRAAEVAYLDGTMGISANAVLHETGDKALKAAVELARSGAWPSPEPRQKLTLPPARFAEKGSYTDEPYPAPEYRMLAAARIWGVFHYFHPYQYLYGEDWDAVLAEFLPRMARAQNAREYHLAVAEMVSHTHDSHCIVSGLDMRQFYGAAPAGVEVRWIENRVVVTRVVDASLKESVHPGHVVTKIDGEPVQKRIDELQRYMAASTPQALMSRVMGNLLSGPVGPGPRVTLKSQDGTEREVSFPRAADNAGLLSPHRGGEVFRLLTPRVGYVDLERLTNAEVDDMFDKFKDTRAIIMDMRGMPQGTAWSIAPRLAEKPATIAAEFRRNLVSGDGIEHLLFEQSIPTTDKPQYKGKTVMLIDERALSQAEHSGLFYRAANGTVLIGSPTQGANGDVTNFPVPGGIRIAFSGLDVRWPDGRQLQRVGLVPDIEVRPTIAGIQAGRDEVLERALAYIEQGK